MKRTRILTLCGIVWFICMGMLARGQTPITINGPDTICAGSADDYSVTINTGISYFWNATYQGSIISTTISGGNSNAHILWTGTGTGTITVYGIDNAGDTVELGTKDVYVTGPPNLYITADFEVLCQPLVDTYRGDSPPPDTACIRYCAYSTVTYTVNGDPNGTFGWQVVGAVSFTPSGNTCVVNWGGPGFGSVTVVDTSEFGCIVQTSICVELIPPPRAKFTTLPLPVNDTLYICDSTEVTFIDQSVSSPSPIVTWYWQFGDGTTSAAQGSLLAPVTHEYNTPGTFIATLTVTNACGCSDIDSMVIVVSDSPGVKITCPAVVCEFDTSTYSVSVNCTVYDWTVIGGTIVSPMPYGSSIQVVWDNVDLNGFGYVGFTPGTNCSPLACTHPTVIKVPVIKQEGTIQGPTSVCVNSQYIYKLPQWPATVFNWHLISAPAGTVLYPSDQPNEIILETGAVAGTIELGVNYQNELLGCGGLAKLVIKIQPIAGISGEDVICLNTTPSYNLVPASYMGNWVLTYPDNTMVYEFGTNTFNAGSTVVFDQVGTYILNVSGTDFCPPQGFYINVYPPPTMPDSIDGPLEICRGVPTEYTAYNAIPGTVFVWSATNGTVNTNAGNTTYATFLPNSGPFQIKVVRQSMSAPYCLSDTLILDLDTPQINLNIQGPDTVCPSSLHPYFTDFVDGESYNWVAIPSQYASVSPVNGSPNVNVLFNEVPVIGQEVLLILTVTKCGGTYKDTQKVFVRGTPNISMSFNPNVDTICALTPLQVTVASAFGFLCTSPQTTIDWDFGDGVTIIDGGLVQSHSYPTFPGVSPVSFTITVTVNNPYCCGGSYIIQREIWIKPAPIAYITPLGPFSFCDTTSYSVELTADVQSGYAPVTNFEWYHNGVPTGVSCSTCTTFYATPTYGLGGYWVTATNSVGCSNTSNIEVVEYKCGNDTCDPVMPSIQVDSTGDCGTVTYTANITGTYYSIAWSAPGSSSTSTVGTAFTANYAQAGAYVVTMSVSVPSTTPGDTCEVAQYFNVLIPYTVGLNYSVMCDPDNPGNYLVTLFDHSNYYPTTNIQNYTFDIDGNTQSDPVLTSYSYSVAPGSVPISLTISGWGFPPCSIYDTLELPALPVAGFTYSLDTTCTIDRPVEFTNTSTDATNYWWDFAEASSYNTEVHVIKVYQNATPHNVMLVASNQYGCSDTVFHTVETIESDLNGELSVVNNGACEGEPVTLNYNPLLLPGYPETYTWIQDPDPYAITTMPTVNVYEPGQYWLIGTNHYGCEVTTPPVPVEIVQVPPAVIYGETDHCVNEQFYLSGYAGPGPVTYRWFKNGAFYSTGPELFQQYSSPTTYTLTLVVSVSGPGGICRDTSAPFVVTVHPLPPDPTINFSLIDCPTYELELDASNTVPGTYNWSNGMVGDPITVYSGGPYTVIFTDTNSCKSKGSIDVPKAADAYLWIFPKGCYSFCYLTMPRYLPGPIIEFDYWAWLQNGGISLDGSNSVPGTYTLTSPGTYNLVLDNGLCPDTSGNMYVEIDSNCTACALAPVRLRRVWQTGDPIGYPCTDSFEVDFGNPGPGGMSYTVTAMNGMVMPYSGSVGVGVTTVPFRYIADPGFTGPEDIVIFTVTMPDGTICIVQIKIRVDPPCGNNAAPRWAGNGEQTEQPGDNKRPAISASGASMLLVPNPAGNSTRVDFSFAEDKERYIEVYDLSGRQMARKRVTAKSGSADLDLGQYAGGLYIVVIRDNGKVMLQSKLTVVK